MRVDEKAVANEKRRGESMRERERKNKERKVENRAQRHRKKCMIKGRMSGTKIITGRVGKEPVSFADSFLAAISCRSQDRIQ